MVYLISRSICQCHRAGFISLAGVAAGFLFYMACAALGRSPFEVKELKLDSGSCFNVG